MRPNQVDTQKVQKQASKDNTPGPKRSKSLKSETKVKKDGQTKSPTVKRPKEIQYSRLLFIQHYFNGTELKKMADDKDEAADAVTPDDDNKEPGKDENENNGDE